MVIAEHKAKAPAHVAAMIGTMATAGDHDGVQTWQAIVEQVDQLMDYRLGRPLSKQ